MFEEDSRPGYKDDTGKLQYHLVDWPAIEQMIRVLMYGARQPNRGPQNWRKVENAIVRYSDAIHRHMSKLAQGEVFDRESGLPHAAHVMCNAMFLVALGSGSDDNENG